MMRIAICDDEKNFRIKIASYLQPYRKENPMEILVFNTGKDLVKSYEDKISFDLIFLDIGMDYINGIETGEMIRKKDENVMIIFITSYNHFVKEAFRLGAFQYLEKPVDQKVFNFEFERAYKIWSKKNKRFIVKWQAEEFPVKVKDIIYIEYLKRHLYIHTNTQIYKMVQKLNAVEEELIAMDFLRIHQSFLVNMAYIKGFKGTTIAINEPAAEILKMSKNLCAKARQGYIEYRNRVFYE